MTKLNRQNGRPSGWELRGLAPTPEEDWHRLRVFLGLSQAEREAMLETVEVLFRRGHELVVDNYDYLLSNHETATILGWEQGADPAHLAERRRFFTVWLARTLGLDFSHDFAHYLFRAGQLHAGHGPRRTHVPELYVTGAISLVHATFARFLTEEMPGSTIVPTALAGWNKTLSLHLQMMLSGYRTARALDAGDFVVKVALFGKMRTLTGRPEMQIQLSVGARAETILQKFFNYYPQARADVFDLNWQSGQRLDATGTPWLTTEKSYQVKPAWRVLVNGKDISYTGGPGVEIAEGDELSIFPPGR